MPIPDPGRARRSERWITAALLLAAILPALPAFGTPFLRDAEVVIRDNVALRSLDGALSAAADNYWGDHVECGLWRPLPLLSYAANHAVGGLEPDGYTAVDVALHALVVVLLFRFARQLGASTGAALVAGLVFAVHPLNSEAVASHVGRADLLAAAGMLCALLALGGLGRGAPGWRARGIAAGGFALALLSKENAVALLPLVGALVLLRPGQVAERDATPDADARHPWLDLLVLGSVLGLWLTVRWTVLGAFGRDPATIEPFINPLVPATTTALGDLRGATGGQALLGALTVLSHALGMFAWPATLSFDYGFDHLPLPTSAADPRVLLGVLAATATLAGCWLLRHRAPLAAVGLVFFGSTYVITGNVFTPIGTIFAERLMYVPDLGLALLVGQVFAWAHARGRGRARVALVGITGALLLAGAARTAERHADWQDHETATAAGVAAAPRSVAMQYARGRFLTLEAEAALARGDPDAAVRLYERAVVHLDLATEIAPEHSPSNRVLFQTLLLLGREEQARVPLEREVVLNPDSVDALTWLARLQAQDGLRARVAGQEDAGRRHAAEARATVEQALSLDPDHVDALRLRAALFRDVLGDPTRAAADLRHVLRVAPDHPDRDAIRAQAEHAEALGARKP